MVLCASGSSKSWPAMAARYRRVSLWREHNSRIHRQALCRRYTNEGHATKPVTVRLLQQRETHVVIALRASRASLRVLALFRYCSAALGPSTFYSADRKRVKHECCNLDGAFAEAANDAGAGDRQGRLCQQGKQRKPVHARYKSLPQQH